MGSENKKNNMQGNIGGSSNVSHTINVGGSKTSTFVSVIVPIVAALAGAYATHQLTLYRAKDITANETATLLGIASEAIEIAQATKAPPELIQKLGNLESQARGVQANLVAMQQPTGVSMQADFWLPVGQGGRLIKGASFGLNVVYGVGDIDVHLNESEIRIPTGKRIPYKPKDGSECFVEYVGASPDGKLHGFKNWCET